MVVRADGQPFRARGPSRERTGLEPHLVVAEDARRVTVQVEPVEVLLERPSAGHVQELHAAADAEQRQLALTGAVGKGELEAVALGARLGDLRVGAGAVGRRVDVHAAGKHEPVEAVEQLVGRLGHVVVRRQHQRERAGSLDRERVGAREHVGLGRPWTPADRLDGGADSDDGPAHSRSKPRTRSQSVTAASCASSSIRARFR